MRNLKKILALVLALVMSLSLMATAGAAETTAAETGSKYQTATDVLQGLEVIRGDEGGFRYQDTITRAEVAAVLYRIATGDVKDTQAGIHTGQPFSDVNANDWYTPYISYCYIAEYIKGNPNGTFEPDTNINGYATLAMILRAMGYGKNGEFEGDGWEIRTASTARQIGILENVFDTQLSGPATRELVAEILFRAMLKDEVKFSALNPYNYESLGTTLGGRNFGLEKVTGGVVVANEWANLEGDKVLKAGTTKLKLADGDYRTLDTVVSEDPAVALDAVGLSYDAYVANGEGGVKKTLTLEKSDKNVVAFNEGKSIKTGLADQGYASVAKLAETEGLSISDSADNETEYFVNYNQAWNEDCTSEYLIRYAVSKDDLAAKSTTWYNFLNDKLTANGGDGTVIIREVKVDLNGDGDTNDANESVECFLRTIRKGNFITATDQDIMEEIFDSADRVINNGEMLPGYLFGEVYVGTTSMKDYSDTYSWNDFYKEFFDDTKTSRRFDFANNGESVRVIDNNNDGVAEYVLKIRYTMDKVVGTYKNALLLNSDKLADYSEANLYCPDELVQGDVVVYTVIDEKMSIWKAEMVTDTIKTKNFSKITVTTSSDDTYGQSGITNETNMDQWIKNMNEKTEYNMYLDRFGFIRVYELAQDTEYALVLEMYPTNQNNISYINNTGAVAEVKIADADIEEYAVSNGVKNIFFSDSVWTSLNKYFNLNNYLQPAVAHLGVSLANQYVGETTYSPSAPGASFANSDWGRTVWAAKSEVPTTGTYFGVFNYGTDTGTSFNFSFTNVAAYTLSDDTISLSSASKLYRDQNDAYHYRGIGSTPGKYENKTYNGWVEWYLKTNNLEANDTNRAAAKSWFDGQLATHKLTYVYDVDYVQLKAQDIAANTRHYNIADNYSNLYHTLSNGYVNAVDSTEFYIVMPGGVDYKVGYSELPTIKADKIRAAYAVAKNTAAAADGQDYWVADVIVIEVNELWHNYDSISLAYYNPWETVSYTRGVDTLNNEWRALQPDSENKAKLTVLPGSSDQAGAYTTWGNTTWETNDYGFYKLYQTEMTDSEELKAAKIEKIEEYYNSYGIYAGTVQRTVSLTGSNYFDICLKGLTPHDGDSCDQAFPIKNSAGSDIPFYRVGTNSANEITLLAINDYSDVILGDEIIVVYNMAKNQVAYYVDLGGRTEAGHGFEYTAPDWLDDEYDAIIAEQIAGKGEPVTGDFIVTVKASYTDAAGDAQTKVLKQYGVLTGGQLTINTAAALPANDLYLEGYTSNVSTAGLSINGTAVAWNATNVSVPNKFVASLNSPISNALYLTGIAANLEVVIPYLAETPDIKTNAGGYGVTQVKAEYGSTPTSAIVSGADLNSIPYGTKVTLTVTVDPTKITNVSELSVQILDNAGTEDPFNATLVGNGAANQYVYTFNMPDYDVKVQAEKVLKQYNVTVTPNENILSYADGNANITGFSTTTGNGKTTWTGALSVTATAKGGYHITGWNIVETGTTTPVLGTDTDATATLAVGTNKDVTITFTVAKDAPVTEVTVAVDAAMDAAVSAKKAGQSEVIPGSTTPTVPPLAANGKVDLAGKNSIWLQFTDSTITPDVTVTGNAVATLRDVNSNVYTYQITDLTGGETITIVPAKATWSAPTINNTTNPGEITVATGTPANQAYAIVADDPTTALQALTVLDTAGDVNTDLSCTLSTTAPTLTKDDGNKWLVFVECAATYATNAKLSKVGCVKIPVFASAAALTVTFAGGTIAATPAAATGTTQKYILVADSGTDIADAQAAIATWSVATSETTIANDVAALTNVAGATTLATADNGKLLIVVTTDDTTHKLIAVGAEIVSGL